MELHRIKNCNKNRERQKHPILSKNPATHIKHDRRRAAADLTVCLPPTTSQAQQRNSKAHRHASGGGALGRWGESVKTPRAERQPLNREVTLSTRTCMWLLFPKVALQQEERAKDYPALLKRPST